jgi:hypothetical protein
MSEKSFILDLESKKNAYNAALSAYEKTRNTYLSLSRKFKFVNDKSLDKTNHSNNTVSDTKEKCMDICTKDVLCAAADFNPTTKTCSIYKTYQDSDMMDSSGNFAILPDTIAIQTDINTTKVEFDIQNADLNAKCDQLISMLSNPKYKTYRDAQSQQNKDLLATLREKKNKLQQDRELIDGMLTKPGFLEDVFNANENVKKSNMTANQNFYIQVVLSVVTVVTIAAAVYYLWPTATAVPLAVPATNSILSNPFSSKPYVSNQNRYMGPSPLYATRGGGRGLNNQSYFVIGGILLFSIIVSHLK